MFGETRDREYVESKIMIQIREDVKRLQISQYMQSVSETLKEMSLKLRTSYLGELSDILNNVVAKLTKKETRMERLEQTLRKYLSYKSIDGNLERQKLRRELQEILDEQA